VSSFLRMQAAGAVRRGTDDSYAHETPTRHSILQATTFDHAAIHHGCRQLARWGERAVSTGLGIEEYRETQRDTHDFGRRVGQLPEQREGDGEVDYRPLLHRDGSVLSAVSLEVCALSQSIAFLTYTQ